MYAVGSDIVYMDKETDFTRPIRTPHWLMGYTERGSKTVMRRNLILRALALHGPLNMYQIQKVIERNENRCIPYPRILQYIASLEKRKAVHRLKEKTKRNAKVYDVGSWVFGYLFFQHFLDREELLQILRRRGILAYLPSSDEGLDFSEEIENVVDRRISASFFQYLVTLHAPHRTRDITPESVNGTISHMDETTFRDIDLEVMQSILRRFVDEDPSGKLLRRYVSSNPGLRQQFLALKVTLETLCDRWEKELLDVRRITGLLDAV